MRSRLILLLSLPIAACSGDDQEPTNETTDVGFVRVTAPTLGLGLDSNGYLVTLDPGTPTAQTQELPVNGRGRFRRHPARGPHVRDRRSVRQLHPGQRPHSVRDRRRRTDPAARLPGHLHRSALTGPNLIAFQSDRDGFTEIYTMNPDGTHQTRVTEDELVNLSPSFAPDGQTIAFVQSSERSQRYLRRRRRRLGRDHSDGDRRWRPILPGRPTPAESRFSPTPTAMGGLAVMNGDGSDLRIVFRGTLLAGKPAWAPDGNSLVFESDSAHHPNRRQWSECVHDLSRRGSQPSLVARPHPRRVRQPVTARWTRYLRDRDRRHRSHSALPRETITRRPGRPTASQIAFSRGAEDSAEQDIFVVNAGRVRPHPADHRSGGRQPPILVALGHRVTNRGSTRSTRGSRNRPETLVPVAGD